MFRLKMFGRSASALILICGVFVATLSLMLDFQTERNTANRSAINGALNAKGIYIASTHLTRDSKSNHGLHYDLFLATTSPCWSTNLPGGALGAVIEENLPALELFQLSFIRAPPFAVPLSPSLLTVKL